MTETFVPPAVPAALASMRNWLVWRLVQKDGQPKPSKIPYYANGAPRPGQQGTPDDRAQLVTLAEAVAAVERSQGWDRPYAGVGFAPQPDSGIVALDFDNCVEDGTVAPHVEAICTGTYTEFSPSGRGIRAFFLGSLLSKKDVPPNMRGPWPVEVFGHNGFVTVTGNVTPTCELFGWNAELAHLTPAALDMYRSRGWDAMQRADTVDAAGAALLTIAQPVGLSLADIAAVLADLPNDLDYDTWVRVGAAVHQETQGSGEGFQVWDTWSRMSPKYTTEEYGRQRWASFGRHSGAQVTMRSVLKMAREARGASRADAGRVDMTDSGNVNALHEITRGSLRYIVERKCFMQWDGMTWSVDESGSAAATATKHVAERYLAEARRLEGEADAAAGDDRKRLLKLSESHRSWANYCRNKRGIDSMLSLAARDDRFAIGVALLDQDRFALGVGNGVVDLRTGQLRPTGRDDLITKRSPFSFNLDAKAPRWERFISEITAAPVPGGQFTMRPALAAYMHRAIGYWATGGVEEHKMFVCVGDGSNGKSVLFDVLAEVLGPYAVAIPPDSMMATGREADGERPTPFARTLAGSRLAYGSEAKEGQKLNAAWVKKQTGDARLTARGLHENAFTFAVTHKLVLLTNHEPHLDHMDEATRGRIHTIPFECRWNRPGVPAPDPNLPDGDKHLMRTLMSEAEGILAWIVRGAVAYAQQGLEPPPEVSARTLAYFDQQDAFAQWLAMLQPCEAKDGTGAAALFASFQAWCTAEGFTSASPRTMRAFSAALQSRGIKSARISSGTVYGLRDAQEVEVAGLF